MWPRILSWVALVSSVLAVVFNVGMVFFAMAYRPNIGAVVLGAFVLSGPISAIFTLLFRAPLVRRANAPAVASAFD